MIWYNNHMIKAIGFDWGGVLVPSKPIMPGISVILGIPQQELYSFYLQHNHKANVENMPYKDLWKFLLKELGHLDKEQQALEHMSKQQTHELDLNMLELVQELKSLDYKVGLLSNNTKEAGSRMRGVGLDKYFDTFLISAEIGFQKPNPKAFEVLLSELDVEPSELIFTDDSIPSLSTSEEIGYTPILFKDYDQFRQELVNLGVLAS